MKVLTGKELAMKHNAEKIVLTASRRTDRPAFYTRELLKGLKEGKFHPQTMMQPMWELNFETSDIHSVGLWSQDPCSECEVLVLSIWLGNYVRRLSRGKSLPLPKAPEEAEDAT